MCCFVWQTIQNPKRFSLISQKTKLKQKIYTFEKLEAGDLFLKNGSKWWVDYDKQLQICCSSVLHILKVFPDLCMWILEVLNMSDSSRYLLFRKYFPSELQLLVSVLSVGYQPFLLRKKKKCSGDWTDDLSAHPDSICPSWKQFWGKIWLQISSWVQYAFHMSASADWIQGDRSHWLALTE